MNHAAGKEVSADGLSVVLTSVSSDSHTWNLVVLQLVLEELGHQVHNLGACVPDELMVSECLRLIRQVRSRPELAGTPMVIGGKLGIAGPGCDRSRAQLTAAGYGAVFEDGTGLTAFQSYVGLLAIGQAS